MKAGEEQGRLFGGVCQRCLGTGVIHNPKRVPCPGCQPLSQGPTDRIDANTPGPSRKADPWTSKAAGASVTEFTGSQRRRVYGAFQVAGADGLIDQDVVDLLASGGSQDTDSGVRTRRSELVALGLLRDSGRVRPTKSGRDSIVWVLVEGLDAAAVAVRMDAPIPKAAAKATGGSASVPF
jgi:hypothetical protein